MQLRNLNADCVILGGMVETKSSLADTPTRLRGHAEDCTDLLW